jgi:peptidoglycan/LPS O-acetylase OafA/YrhL
MNSQTIRFLTPMRGVAAVFIAVKHTLIWLPALWAAVLSRTALLGRSYLWVDFFFVLSGFILMHVYGGTSPASWRNGAYAQFLRARFARIYPLYLFALLAFAVPVWLLSMQAGYSGSNRFSVASFFSNLLMVQSLGLHDELTWNFAAWSVSVEFFAYLMFPFLAVAVAHRIGRWLLPVAALLLFALVYAVKGNLDYHHDFGLVRCVTEFALGMTVYRWGYGRMPNFMRVSALPALGTMLMVLAMLHVEAAFIPDYMLVPAFAAMILALASYGGSALAWLDSAPANMLGKLSYSIYLNHLLVLELPMMLLWPAVHDHPDAFHPGLAASAALVLLALALIVALSALTYRYIEVPARRWLGRGLTDTRSRQRPDQLLAP